MRAYLDTGGARYDAILVDACAADDQVISGAMTFAGGEGLAELQVNKSAGSLQLQRTLTVERNATAPGTITIVEGEFDLNGNQLICEAGVTVQDGGTLSVVNGAFPDHHDGWFKWHPGGRVGRRGERRRFRQPGSSRRRPRQLGDQLG